jgi:hypothetical protein
MMVHNDENYGQHGVVGTDDLVEQASLDGKVRDELADADRRTEPNRQDEDHAALIEGSDSTRFRDRWHDVQAAFVDDPRRAVSDADQLVAELMQTLAATFAERRHALEGQWQKGHDAETEDLRLAMRSYRSFFDQLLPH